MTSISNDAREMIWLVSFFLISLLFLATMVAYLFQPPAYAPIAQSERHAAAYCSASTDSIHAVRSGSVGTPFGGDST
jgi:hypothetical protein